MIKKILLWLWITFLSFIGFSNATFQFFEVWVDRFMSKWNLQYEVWFLPKWRLISTYLWTSKALVWLDDKYLIFWSNDWLYLYNPWSFNAQWYFQYLMSCDAIDYNDSTWDALQNCTATQSFELWSELVSNFINSIKQWDLIFIEDETTRMGCGSYCSYDRYNIKVCFSSSTVSRTMCFLWDSSSYWWSNPTYGSRLPLLNSLWLSSDVGFGSINRSILTDPPWFMWWTIDWSSGIWQNTSLSWNLMYSTCTNWYVVSEVSKLYWWINNICYAWTNNTWIINDWVARTPMLQWLNFKEVYNWSLNVTINGATPYYSNYLDWFNTWIIAMQKYKLWQISFDVFNWQPVYLYAYFDRLYQNGVIPWQTDAYNIANICKLALFSDYTQKYNWSQFSYVCDQLSYNPWNSWIVTTWEVGSIDNDNQEILPPWTIIWWWNNWWSSNTSSWTIVSVDWSWTLSWNTNQNFDWKTFINDFYQKLQSNFQKPTNNLTWIVPVYIYVFLIALILFRFLSH